MNRRGAPVKVESALRVEKIAVEKPTPVKKKKRLPVKLIEFREWLLSTPHTADSPSEQLLLESGLAAFDRMEEARKIIDREGCVTKDRFGQKRAHPAISIERDCKASMLHAFAALHLDLEPLRDRPGRPPGKGVPIHADK